MDNLTGKIFDGDELLVKDVTIKLDEAESSAEASDWHGSFALHYNPFSEINHKLRLLLSDGRSGKIRIHNPDSVIGADELLIFRFSGTDFLR